MFENVGAGEILLILIVVLIFFGPKKIPELAASLGKGIRKFNEAKDNLETQVKTVMKEPLEAINEAKEGFERQLNSAASGLSPQPAVGQPALQASPVTPQLQPPVESTPRGAIAETSTSAIPATPTAAVPEIPKHEA